MNRESESDFLGVNSERWYEIHITVCLQSKDEEDFKSVCKLLGVKAIVLDLEHDPEQVAMRDVMTSSKLKTNDAGSLREADRIANGLTGSGFVVLRKKIECEPGHPLAPQNHFHSMPKGHYFESHIAFTIREHERKQLTTLAHRVGAHISRNPFKQTEKGMVIMVTLRDYTSPFTEFKKSIAHALDIFKESGYIPSKKIEVEFAYYDSQIMHDERWLIRR
jgi:hypothetical protein